MGNFSRCRCEDEEHMARQHGVKSYLFEGLPLASLNKLGGGCTDAQYVCPRLDRLRRMVGQ